MTDFITRTLTVERANEAGDVFPCVAATETPVLRDDFWEVLDMERLDLSRAPLPVIESHDTRTLNIGLLENLRVQGGKLRGDIRLGKSQRATELAEDIRAGIVRSVSIGYLASNPIEVGEKDGLAILRFAATPHELSLVAAPADQNSGIGRSKDYQTMGKETKPSSDGANGRKEDIMRVKQIRTLGDEHGLQELADGYVERGDSFEAFCDAVLAEVGKRNDEARGETREFTFNQPNQPGHLSAARFSGYPCDNEDLPQQVMERYSVVKLLRGIADPKQLDEAGLELDISKTMQRALGRKSQGVIMPFEALHGPAERAVTISGTGGNLKPTEHLAGRFIDVLRNKSYVMSLNPTVLQGLSGDVDIPKKMSGASAFWIGGDDADSITTSDQALGQVEMAPNTVGGATTFSHKMIIQSSPDVETMVRRDLADMIAVEIDAKAINGSGSSNQPRGILNTTGINAHTYANGGSPDFDHVVQLETLICDDNAEGPQMAYLTTPLLRGQFKTTPRQTSGVEGNFVWQNGAMNDYPAWATKNVPAGTVILGNWAELIVGFWGGLEIMADPYGANFLKGSVTVRVLADVDINVRHAEAFAALTESP